MEMLANFLGAYLPDWIVYLILTLLKIVATILPLILLVAYATYAERKIIGFMQVRIGPNRVGFKGLLQPFADMFKLIFKEIVVPAISNRFLFLIAPLLSMGPAFAAWSVMPFGDTLVLANVNAGLLFMLALASLGVYGVIMAGWASNSKYAQLSALRIGAQMVSYEIAMGFALVGVLMASGSLNLGDIVRAQSGSIFSWFVWPLFGLFMVYFISGVAETNRAPFDVAEGESEIVAGFHVEYSGMAFSIFFLAEYANMWLISALSSLMFLGGWLSPFQGLDFLTNLPVIGLVFGNGLHWFLLKAAFFMLMFFWLRATFPRYRYDQIMRLGWKVLIPVALVWIFGEGLAIALGWKPWL